MGEPCINKKCGAYEKDEDYNCGHIIMDDPTKCKSYLMEKTEPVAEVPCSDRVIKPCPNCKNEAKHYPESHSQANAIYCNECPLGVESAGMSDAALFMVWNNLPRDL